MATHVTHRHADLADARASRSSLDFLAPLGRTLFGLIFVEAGIGHFSSRAIGYAASAGVPLASIAVPLSGVLALLGGASIILGYRARLGALLLVLFLVPVTFMMHAFWNVADPAAQGIQKVMFFKNLSMLGAALFFLRAGAGPLSLDARRADRITG